MTRGLNNIVNDWCGSSLQKLLLLDFGSTDGGAAATSCFASLTAVQELIIQAEDMNDCSLQPSLIHALSHLSSLCRFELSFLGITEEAMSALAPVLSQLRHLQVLNFDENHFETAAAPLFSASFLFRLRFCASAAWMMRDSRRRQSCFHFFRTSVYSMSATTTARRPLWLSRHTPFLPSSSHSRSRRQHSHCRCTSCLLLSFAISASSAWARYSQP